MGETASTLTKRTSKLSLVCLLGILVVGNLLSTSTPAAASTGIHVFVSYADSARANATNFPTPWAGSPQTVFPGCKPAPTCEYDGGAIRVVNNTGGTVVVNSITVHIDTCIYTGWAPATLPPGYDLIVTQLGSGAASGCTGPAPIGMDSSDIGPGGIPYALHCTPDGIQPVVDVTIDGTTTTYTDSGQVLNTGGKDLGGCPLGSNESTQWTTIGNAPCYGSVLSLAPTSQTLAIGMTATLTATFTNSCGEPLSNVAVTFKAQSGPNAGLTFSGATNADGQATMSYSSAVAGTDQWQAAVQNVAGTITSNTAAVTWVAFALGGGGFVIGNLNDTGVGATVYWWGAQWWKKDQLSGGLAPASFKGFEKSNLVPSCGSAWTTRPGNSPHPPQTVSPVMAVIVASHITKKGPVISGDIVHIVLVRTNPGYGPNPGHPGTGTIVGTIC